MNKKTKNIRIFGALLAVTAIAVLIFVLPANSVKPPAPKPNYIDTNRDGIPDTYFSFSTFQALRIVYPDGSDSWKYPHSRTTLTPYSIIDNDNSKVVSTIQASVFFTLYSSKSVASVTYSCSMSVEIFTAAKQLFKSVGSIPISQVVTNPQNDTDVEVVSSTITASYLQALTEPTLNFNVNYYYVFSGSTFVAQVTWADGTSGSFVAQGTQNMEQQLWWNFKLLGPMQLVSLGATWK